MFVLSSMLFCDDLFSFLGFAVMGKGTIMKLIFKIWQEMINGFSLQSFDFDHVFSTLSKNCIKVENATV